MEIVHNDDVLREEILNDAEKKAERILNKVNREADELIKKNDEILNNIKNEYEVQYSKDTEEKIKIINASNEIEINKLKTKYCGSLVDKAFQIVTEKIENNDLVKYEDMILNIILKSMEKIESDELLIEINSTELKKISKDKILKLKQKKKNIKRIDSNDDIEGIILYSKDKKLAVYISINKYFENFKNQYRTMIFKVLTGDINE